MDKLQTLLDGGSVQNFTANQGLLRRKNRLVIGPIDQLRKSLIAWHHSSPESGHTGEIFSLEGDD